MAEKVSKKTPKTIGDKGIVKVPVFVDEWKDLELNAKMTLAEATTKVRERLGVPNPERLKQPSIKTQIVERIKSMTEEEQEAVLAELNEER